MPLIELLRQLRASPSTHAFTVLQPPGYNDVFLGIDAEARPCLFIRASELAASPPLRTAQISLRLGQEYSIAPPEGGTRTERLDALRCETSEAADEETFLVLLEAFLGSSRAGVLDRNALTKFFLSMARLFSVKASNDLQSERQGLWGELFFMSRVRGFAFWAPFWHSETTRKFDFSSGTNRIEVKTSIGGVRLHHFAHRQLYAVGDEEIMILSLLLRKEDAGLSLRELIMEARAALVESEQYFKLEQAVRQAGMEMMEEPGPAYDAAEASKLLAWYKAENAPRFTIPEPPGVSQTHYRVDLSTAPQVEKNEANRWLDNWRVLSPIMS